MYSKNCEQRLIILRLTPPPQVLVRMCSQLTELEIYSALPLLLSYCLMSSAPLLSHFSTLATTVKKSLTEEF
jgi:hypothetical protein